MATDSGVHLLVGESAAIKAVQHLIHQVARKPTTVLIHGESGTGKELVARIIHQLSNRSHGPFIAINCAAIPYELLESELFGHEKGAFTGAIGARQGRFELAAGGTLFLDEIGDMPMGMQAKLLRVLQERVFERVGGTRAVKADVRILAATHKNLESSIKEGHFREDLYYRLNVFPITVPSLAERRADISILIHDFINQYAREHSIKIALSPEVISYFESYAWPGNVRELYNVIERLLILYPNKLIKLEDLPRSILRPTHNSHQLLTNTVTETLLKEGGQFDLKQHLAQLELKLITEALQNCRGVVARAAKTLGLRRTTLVEKMKKYGIGRDLDYTESEIS